MDRPRLALLNCAHDPADTRRNFRRELDADLVEYHVVAGQLPAEGDVDGIVVTGSASSVYDEDPWIADTIGWVRDALDDDLPALGVCFGHQLLATALGGAVVDMGEYELGYREIRHEGGWPFDGIDSPFTAFTTHSDTVETLPPGAAVLADNDYGVQSFVAGDVLGVQFHPEYDAETAVMVTERKDLPRDRIDAVLEGITPEAVDRAAPAKRVFDAFLARVRARSDRPEIEG